MAARVVACIITLSLSASLRAASDGVAAAWDFGEGKGNVLRDKSGNNRHGKIHGAQWGKSGKGYALRFDGVNDYVDCGGAAALKFTDSFSLVLWVAHDAVGGWQDYVGNYVGGVSGYVIAQNGGRLHFHNAGTRPYVLDATAPTLIPNVWHHVAAIYDRQAGTMRICLDGRTVASQKVVGSLKPSLSDNLRIGAYQGGRECFRGMLDGVRIYNRALSEREVAAQYAADPRSRDKEMLRHVLLEPFFYPDTEQAVLSVNFRRIVPVAEATTVVAELARAGEEKPLQSKKLDPKAPGHEDEAPFSLKGLKPGKYELRAVVHDGKGKIKIERVEFRYPLDPLGPVAAPDAGAVGALPPAVEPPPYKLEVAEGGGFTVSVKGRAYRLESSYSYPHGGENRLLAGAPDRKGEESWKVTTRTLDAKTHEVVAGGKSYSITRRIHLERTRIVLKDTIRNTSDDVVGIILSNHLNVRGMDDIEATMMNGLTAFVHVEDGGVGILALDDLYQLQQKRRFENGLAELRTQHFGLDKGASYTIEWAVYPTATNNYYDFINQVRRDEGLNGGRVEGTWIGGVKPGEMPTKEYVDLFKVRYLSIRTPWHPVDDPGVSIEGIEYMEYPKENELLRKFFEKAKLLHPDMKVMIHVAHGLYVTNKPKELFGDSLVIKADGEMIDYGNRKDAYYRKYFSEQRVKEGYRWYIFYPTMENSFGKAMIRAMRYMVDEIGATGMWADGFVSGYAQVGGNTGGYSYDRWDGHSVDIDPATKLVTRKKTCVPWVSLPVLKKTVQIIAAAGGVTLTNSGRNAGSRSLWQENIISSCEGSRKAVIALHLGRTPASLSSAAPTPRASYRDILKKLELGSLYFWYRYTMDHKTLVEHMYPITLESIHPGTIRGRERIVTKYSGVYGWRGDRSLHVVYLYDARGYLAGNDFLTTVDGAGARTELALKKDQSAAVVRLPIALTPSVPVNVNVRRYDAKEVRMVLNGRGKATLRLDHGQFPVEAGAAYRIDAGKRTREVRADAKGGVTVSVSLEGPTELVITRP